MQPTLAGELVKRAPLIDVDPAVLSNPIHVSSSSHADGADHTKNVRPCGEMVATLNSKDVPRRRRPSSSVTKSLRFRGERFFLSLRGGSTTQLEADITALGGVIERFLSREITCVVTDRCDTATVSPDETKKPVSPSMAPSPVGRNAPPPVAALSRGRALLLRSNSSTVLSAATASSDPVQFARCWSIPVVSMAVVVRALRRCASRRASACAAGGGSAAGGRPSNTQRLSGTYIKVEDVCRRSRPIFASLADFPALNLCADSTRGPFEGPVSRGPLAAAGLRLTGVRASGGGGAQRASGGGGAQRKGAAGVAVREFGYCEICDERFNELSEHLGGMRHRPFASNPDNFVQLDALIESLPSLDALIGSMPSVGAENCSCVKGVSGAHANRNSNPSPGRVVEGPTSVLERTPSANKPSGGQAGVDVRPMIRFIDDCSEGAGTAAVSGNTVAVSGNTAEMESYDGRPCSSVHLKVDTVTLGRTLGAVRRVERGGYCRAGGSAGADSCGAASPLTSTDWSPVTEPMLPSVQPVRETVLPSVQPVREVILPFSHAVREAGAVAELKNSLPLAGRMCEHWDNDPHAVSRGMAMTQVTHSDSQIAHITVGRFAVNEIERVALLNDGHIAYNGASLSEIQSSLAQQEHALDLGLVDTRSPSRAPRCSLLLCDVTRAAAAPQCCAAVTQRDVSSAHGFCLSSDEGSDWRAQIRRACTEALSTLPASNDLRSSPLSLTAGNPSVSGNNPVALENLLAAEIPVAGENPVPAEIVAKMENPATAEILAIMEISGTTENPVIAEIPAAEDNPAAAESPIDVEACSDTSSTLVGSGGPYSDISSCLTANENKSGVDVRRLSDIGRSARESGSYSLPLAGLEGAGPSASTGDCNITAMMTMTQDAALYESLQYSHFDLECGMRHSLAVSALPPAIVESNDLIDLSKSLFSRLNACINAFTTDKSFLSQPIKSDSQIISDAQIILDTQIRSDAQIKSDTQIKSGVQITNNSTTPSKQSIVRPWEMTSSAPPLSAYDKVASASAVDHALSSLSESLYSTGTQSSVGELSGHACGMNSHSKIFYELPQELLFEGGGCSKRVDSKPEAFNKCSMVGLSGVEWPGLGMEYPALSQPLGLQANSCTELNSTFENSADGLSLVGHVDADASDRQHRGAGVESDKSKVFGDRNICETEIKRNCDAPNAAPGCAEVLAGLDGVSALGHLAALLAVPFSNDWYQEHPSSPAPRRSTDVRSMDVSPRHALLEHVAVVRERPEVASLCRSTAESCNRDSTCDTNPIMTMRCETDSHDIFEAFGIAPEPVVDDDGILDPTGILAMLRLLNGEEIRPAAVAGRPAAVAARPAAVAVKPWMAENLSLAYPNGFSLPGNPASSGRAAVSLASEWEGWSVPRVNEPCVTIDRASTLVTFDATVQNKSSDALGQVALPAPHSLGVMSCTLPMTPAHLPVSQPGPEILPTNELKAMGTPCSGNVSMCDTKRWKGAKVEGDGMRVSPGHWAVLSSTGGGPSVEGAEEERPSMNEAEEEASLMEEASPMMEGAEGGQFLWRVTRGTGLKLHFARLQLLTGQWTATPVD